MQFFADKFFYLFGHIDGKLDLWLILCHIQKGFVKRQWFNLVGIIVEYLMNLL